MNPMPPAPQHAAQPKQVLYPSTFIEVVANPDGNVILQVHAPGSGEILVFPMGADAAKEIGAKLIAPHVHVAGANGNGKAL